MSDSLSKRAVLIVDPDTVMQGALTRCLPGGATVDVRGDFVGARTRLLARTPDLLVTNMRLREYNGLQLVHLVTTLALPTRAVVYSEWNDWGLAREAQAAGAFYVPRPQLVATLPKYLSADLPAQDRRDIACPERRQFSRGGRRAMDTHAPSPG